MDKLVSRLSLWNMRATAAHLAISVGMLILFWRQLPPEVPMLYSRPWGNEQLVPPVYLWTMPAIGVGVGVLIGLWSSRPQKESLRKAICLGTSLVTQFILALGLVRIIYLVT